MVPAGDPLPLDWSDAQDLAAYYTAMNGTRGFLLHEGLKRVFACVARGNEFVQSSQPWALAKKPEARAELEHAIHLAPFMPNKAQELWQQLGAPGRVEEQRFASVATLDATGWRVAKGASLFPKPQSTPA